MARIAVPLLALLALALAGGAYALLPQQGTSADLLTQANVRIDGQAPGDKLSLVMAGAGDVNGDGLGDVLLGAPGADNNGDGSGAVYVIFGRTTQGVIDLNSLGSGGFRIDGAAAGHSLSLSSSGAAAAGTGDVNGDGLGDLVMACCIGSANNAVWVVFGKTTTTNVSLAALGTGGYKITGTANTNFGNGVAGGHDVNGDGRSDTVIGAPLGGTNGRGQAFVVFGKSDTATVDTTALGSAGFAMTGAADFDDVGAAVSAAGDMNGDGKAELLVGADGVSAGAGAAYVIFGKSTNTSVNFAALGAQGFVINGASAGHNLGRVIAGIGDMNGDARGDFVVGAQQTDYTFNNAGSAYVVFGKSSTTAVSAAALGDGGFRIDGGSDSGKLGRSVGPAGDFNGDGVVDVIVGEVDGDKPGLTNTGISWVVFGKSSFGTIELDDAAPPTGAVAIYGSNADDLTGRSVGGGIDFNGDGRSDVIAGDELSDINGKTDSGYVSIFYGFGTPTFTLPASRTTTAGTAIEALTPTVTGRTGTPTWSVAPALPAGLTLNTATGVVSGTPAAAQAATSYTLTMTDLAGTAQQPFSVTVNAAPTGGGGGGGGTTPVKPANVKPPTVKGTAKVGRRLRCAAGQWTGTPAPTIKVRWLRNGKAIAKATRRRYKVVRRDKGKKLACRETATNTAGKASKTSAAKRVR